jgi:hypothetical protein
MRKLLQLDVDFCSIALDAFCALAQQLTLKVTTSEENTLCLENDNVLLSVFRERDSGMIYVEFADKKNSETFVLSEIVKALPVDHLLISECAGNDKDSASHCLTCLAQTCLQCLMNVSALDAKAFQTVKDDIKKTRHRFTMQFQYGPRIARANAAWESKNWKAAHRLYEECEPVLSIVEKKRLQFLSERQH